jgi:hypothetical protein
VQRSTEPLQHAYVPPTSYQPSFAEQSVQLVHPQLVAVPAQFGVYVHAPSTHASAVHELPSPHVVQPLRRTRELVTLETQLVPLHVCVRYSWSWQVQR